MKRNLILTAMVPMLLLALSASSDDAGRRSSRMNDGGISPAQGKMAERLDLTDDQVKQFEQIQEGNVEKRGTFRKELRRLRHELEGVMMDDNPDVGQVRQLAEKIGAVHTSMQINMLETRLALRNVLTDEQRDKFVGGFPGRGGGLFGGCFNGMGDSGRDCDYNDRGGRGKGHGRHGGHGGRGGHCGHGMW